MFLWFAPGPRGRTFAVAVAGVVAIAATGAGAATVHRLAVAQGTGSLGATTFFTTTQSGGALQGEVATSSPNTTIQIPFGLLGEYDASPGQFGVGVIGVATTGYGIGAEALGANPAIAAVGAGTGGGIVVQNTGGGVGMSVANTGKSLNDVAISATSGGSAATMMSTNTTGEALRASTAGANAFAAAIDAPDNGLLVTTDAGASAGTGSSAVQATGNADSGGFSFLGLATGEGAMLNGGSGNTAHPVLSVADGVGGSDLIGAYTYDGGAFPESFIVQFGTQDRSGAAVYPAGSDVQISGDLFIHGRVYDRCSAFPATTSTTCHDITDASGGTTSVATTASGRSVGTYAAKQSQPTVEDFGESHLSNGVAYIALDPAFAQTISRTTPYLVFVTPLGASHGIYVANRTTNGFEVHESDGSRSSIAVDYRIVATPLAGNAPRFPAIVRQNDTTVPRTDPSIVSRRAVATQLRNERHVSVKAIPTIRPFFTK